MSESLSPPGPQEWVTSFLKAQVKANSTLECDGSHQILYNRLIIRSPKSISDTSSDSLTTKDGARSLIQTAVISTFMSFPWSPICFAPYVGAGMLAAAVIPYSDHMSNSSFFHEAQYRSLGELVGSPVGPEKMKPDTSKCIVNIRTATGHTSAPADPFHSMEDQLGAKSLQIGDEITLDVSQAEPAENREDYEDTHPSNAGIILAMKICGALAMQGYDAETVHKVGSLVAANLATAYQHQVINMHFEDGNDKSRPTIPILEEDIDNQRKGGIVKPLIDKMLRMLLDPTLKRSKTVRMNSNEVVLLVNDLGEIDGVSLRAVTSHTIGILQDVWNICPVRVYAGHFMESHISGFSITLLNVVNTDIGGPSMIQLLDAPCDAQGWNSFAIRETWYGRDMLSKQEKEPMSLVPDRDLMLSTPTDRDGNISDESSIEEEAEKAIHLDDVENRVKNVPSSNETDKSFDDPVSPPSAFPTAMVEHATYVTKPDTPLMSPKADKSGSDNDDDDDDLFPIEDVATGSKKESEVAEPVKYSYEEPDRLPINHPTWQHDDEHSSLVDLIRSQAAKLAVTVVGKSGVDDESGKPFEGTVKKSMEEEDDDFELVDERSSDA